MEPIKTRVNRTVSRCKSKTSISILILNNYRPSKANKMSLFEPGRKKTGGRAKGARNKLSVAFLEAFAADFEQHGAEVIKIVRVEKPSEYLKTAAYLMPKGFEITETRLMEIPDGAKTKSFNDRWRREIKYPRLGIV